MIDLRPSRWTAYAAAAGVVSASTAFAMAVVGRAELADVVMVLLLGTVIVSLRLGMGPSIFAAALSVATYDYFFIPPYGTLYVTEPRHLVTFVVMFLVAIVISRLTTRVRHHAEAAQSREQRTAVLYSLSRDLARAIGVDAIAAAAARHIEGVFGSHVTILAPGPGDNLAPIIESTDLPSVACAERGVARSAWVSRLPAGLGTPTFSDSSGLYLPLVASQGVVGILGLFPGDRSRFGSADQRTLLDTFAAQLAAAIERAQLAEQAEERRVQIEAEQLRNALLSSVSHDLRTPLAVITGAASTMLDEKHDLPDAERRELLKSLYEEGDRLNRLIGNLLDMTRLEAGAVKVKREWYPIDELVGVAMNRTETRLVHRKVQVVAEPDLLVPVDGLLVEQALVNLLENAAKYTPRGTPIDVEARNVGGKLVIDVADRGPGLLAGEEERVFEKFYRGQRDGLPAGAGLGLTIARGIATAHGGTLQARNRTGGGTVFTLTLPIDGEPPAPPAQPVENASMVPRDREPV